MLEIATRDNGKSHTFGIFGKSTRNAHFATRRYLVHPRDPCALAMLVVAIDIATMARSMRQ
jgi:hypothetical protein